MALATLTVDLILKAAGFESDMGRASKTAQKRMQEIQKSAVAVGRAIGVALTAAATATAIAVKSAIDRADEMSKAAQKIGFSTEALSRLEYAAELSGVSLEQLTGAIVKMEKFTAEAADTGSEAAGIFKAFGIEAIDPLTGKVRDGEKVFREFIDVLSKLDAETQNSIGSKPFGKQFADLIPLINGGTEALDRLGQESDRIGNTISTGAGQAAEEFNDRLDTMKRTLGGVALSIAEEMLPQLNELAASLQTAAENGEAVEKIKGVFEVVGIAAKIVAGLLQAVADTVQTLTSQVLAFGNVASAQLKLLRGDVKGALADFAAAKQEFGAAIDAGAETRRNLGMEAGPTVAGPKIEWIDPPAGRSAGAAAAQSAAKKILDADNAKRRASEAASAARRGEAAAHKAAAAAAREQVDREKELADELKKVADASADFRVRAEDLAATLSGPLAEAELQYKRDKAELRELAKDGEIGTVEQTRAEADLAAQYAKTTAEIQDRLDTGKKVLEDLQFQIDLTNMATEAERQRAIFMHENATATQEQADAFVRMNEQLAESREAIDAADQFRGHWEDAFASILDGSKSIKDAFNDLAKSILSDIARMLAKKWVEQLFGNFGTNLGGFEGFFGSANGNVFNAGQLQPFAAGGIVNGPTLFPMARGMGLMGEAGPEAVMPLKRGRDGKLGVSGGGGTTQNNYFSLSKRNDNRSERQIAQSTGRAIRMAR